MSVSDEMMYKYYELLTDENIDKIKSDVTSGKLHPKDAKVNLAKIIVSQYHGAGEAQRQAEEFARAFKDRGFPEDIALTEIKIESDICALIIAITEHTKLLASRGEAKRKIQEGAVELDGVKVKDPNLELESNKEYKIRVGKKFARLFLKRN